MVQPVVWHLLAAATAEYQHRQTVVGDKYWHWPAGDFDSIWQRKSVTTTVFGSMIYDSFWSLECIQYNDFINYLNWGRERVSQQRWPSFSDFLTSWFVLTRRYLKLYRSSSIWDLKTKSETELFVDNNFFYVRDFPWDILKITQQMNKYCENIFVH